MSSAHMLSGYTPPYIEYKPAKVGDSSVHHAAKSLDSQHMPAVRVTLSPEAHAAMKAHKTDK